MATFYKRTGKRGVRWTARVRLAGREITKSFGTKGAAEGWVRTQEGAIETGDFRRPAGSGVILADLIDVFSEHRKTIRRPLGKTATNSPSEFAKTSAASPQTRSRLHSGGSTRSTGSRAARRRRRPQDLLYAASVVRHAARDGIAVHRDAPSQAQLQLKDEGLRISSRMRERRISDAELAARLEWIDANASRTHVPLGDIVRFALATTMRRGEILNIRHEDLRGRVILIRNRKHPRDHERIDECPLLKAHLIWPRDDPLDIIVRHAPLTDIKARERAR